MNTVKQYSSLKRKTPLRAKTTLKAKTSLKAKTPLKSNRSIEKVPNAEPCVPSESIKNVYITPSKYTFNLQGKPINNSHTKKKQYSARKGSAPYWSIFTDDLSICHITGYKGAVPHHVFNGSNKALSEKFGFILPLRPDWHTVSNYSIHQDRRLEVKYKAICERYFLNHYGTQEEFIKLFGRSWLEEDRKLSEATA